MGESPPSTGKLSVKTGPQLSLYFGLVFFWFSVGCFFAFSGVFSGDLRFYCSYPHPSSPSFLKFFFLSVGQWSPYSGQWHNVSLSVEFPPRCQATFLTSHHVRKHRVIFCIQNTLTNLIIRAWEFVFR